MNLQFLLNPQRWNKASAIGCIFRSSRGVSYALHIKSRQDKRHIEPHDTSAYSSVSFDFGYSSRLIGDADKLTILCIHDRATKLVHAIPAEHKGGKSFQYLLGELCRCIMWTGHRNKQANGAVESTTQMVRNQANLLIQQIERLNTVVELKKILFSSARPLYQWAVIHSCWLHNRYNVTNGENSFERCTGRESRGQLCIFGECVMGFFNIQQKD